MLLTSLFLAAVARSAASPVAVAAPNALTPSPACVLAAAINISQCDSTRTRTMLDILWSCIKVVLLCTYVLVHHNIPDQSDSWAKVAWTKLRAMLYALVAPEVALMWALRQRIMAGKIAERNRHREWTRTHGFFVQMGGLMQRVQNQRGVVYQVAGIATRENGYHVDWQSIKIPRIPEKEIKDRGKGDVLLRAIVFLQTTWFVVQCIARHAQGLVLTEIELATLAFVALSVVTYGLWWDKPFNVGYPIYFDEEGNRVDGPEEQKNSEETWDQKARVGTKGYSQLEEKASHRQGVMEVMWKKGIVAPLKGVFGPLWDMAFEEGSKNRVTSVHPFYGAWTSITERSLAALVYGLVIGMVFGGIHLLGWSFQFPTMTELWLWRASSMVITVTPLGLTISYAILFLTERVSRQSLKELYQGTAVLLLYPTCYVGVPLYFAARIILAFLSFFTLRTLPEFAYQDVRWTEFIPHI
ncbi:hypothetical protein AX16_008560 [Volvariella volvacea WC 439]|nr:hypothetical protein AX16_008560 [Volvariella volvacea WC 439]